MSSRFSPPRLTNPRTPWVIIPLLIILYAGELVWRERDAGLGEIADAAPVPEWVFFLGKFLGLALMLVAWMALLTAAGMLIQVGTGVSDFELGLYLRVLFGLQLPDYLLFALLALVVQGWSSRSTSGHLVALIAYGSIVFASRLGIQHRLLVYGSAPGWSYTDMRGFGPSLGPWLWFKLYWVAWALLLAVVARLLWVRGRERASRAAPAGARPVHASDGWAAAAAVGAILALGGFIFYNTNVLNAYAPPPRRRSGAPSTSGATGSTQVPQPRLTRPTCTSRSIPAAGGGDPRHLPPREPQRGGHRLHPRGHSLGSPDRSRRLRPACEPVLADEDLGHRIYALEQPLRPGESLRLDFEVHFKPKGFRNSGVDRGRRRTAPTSERWLPAIGYQPRRELASAGERARTDSPRPLFPSR